MEEKPEQDERKPYEPPAFEVESFFEQVGFFSGDSNCGSHWCSTAGYCSSYNGNSCR